MILKLKPAFKDYIWGGTKLRDDFGFKSDLKKIAEGWMLSCHKDGENVIDGGKFDGKTLSEVIKETGKDILGTKAQKYDFFPILIKLIDAKDNLSVQVHPNDDYALRVEGEYGKTECWYVIDCDEGAELIYGFKKKISNEEFRKRIEDNTFLDVVNHVKVKRVNFSLSNPAHYMQSEKEFFLRKFSKIPIRHIAYTITTVWELTESQESYTQKKPSTLQNANHRKITV